MTSFWAKRTYSNLMRITLKTFAGNAYQIDVEPNQTISTIKGILYDKFGIEEPYTLSYQSKQLNNIQTIDSINYSDEKSILIIKRKIPNQNSAKHLQARKVDPITHNNTAIQTRTESSKPETNINTEKENSSINVEFKTTLHSSPLKNLILSAQTKYGDPPDFNDKVNSLKVLGYDQSSIKRALRAALYRIDLAADYLTSGNIPDIPQQLNLEDNTETQSENQGEEEEVDELTQYKNDLLYLKTVFQKEPHNFAHYVSELERNGYEIARTIRRDPSLFLYQLGLDPSNYDIESVKAPTSKYEELMSAFDENERSAIHRIEAAGFDTMTVIQVFTACDKNEELATSCLLSMK